MNGPDRSLIEDEFHQAAQRILARPPSPRPQKLRQPKQVYQRLNPSLANNVTSGRQKLAQERRCRICHEQQHRLTRHHLVPHAWFLQRKPEIRVLRNANANIVPLCDPCHRTIHSGRDPVIKLQKRATLRGALYPNEVAFILQVKGEAWFDREYPKDP